MNSSSLKKQPRLKGGNPSPRRKPLQVSDVSSSDWRKKHSEDMENRKSRIMNIIKNWIGGPIVIENLSERPLSRNNIRRTFVALTYLAREEYVRLIPDENSVLSTIERGDKFDSFQ